MRLRVCKHYNRIIDKEQKQVLAITEMSCPWLDNCEVRDMEKTEIWSTNVGIEREKSWPPSESV